MASAPPGFEFDGLEVTCNEYTPSFLTEFRRLVNECEFFSLDTEFTGLHPTGCGRESPLETLTQHFNREKAAAGEFLIIQVGVCLFTWNSDRTRLIARPFTFYTYPRPFRGVNSKFSIESICLQFLADNGMDFNKVFRDGIPFLTYDQEEFLKSRAAGQQAAAVAAAEREPGRATTPGSLGKRRPRRRSVSRDRRITSKFGQECEALKNDIAQWATEGNQAVGELFSFKVNRKSLCHALQTHVLSSYPNLWLDILALETTPGSEATYMVTVRRVDAIERRALQAELDRAEEEELQRAVGFRLVIDILSQSRKPLVGHNCWMDVIKTVNQYCTSVQSMTLPDFKARLHALFPVIIDTKQIMEAINAQTTVPVVPSTRLEDAYVFLKSTPTAEALPIDVHRSAIDFLDKHSHHAGYDAFITGSLCAWLAVVSIPAGVTPTTLFAHLHHRYQITNRLYVRNSGFVLNLTGTDVVPQKPLVRGIVGASSRMQLRDLERGLNHEIPDARVTFVDSNRALVSFVDAASVERFEELWPHRKFAQTVTMVTYPMFSQLSEVIDGELGGNRNGNDTSSGNAPGASTQGSGGSGGASTPPGSVSSSNVTGQRRSSASSGHSSIDGGGTHLTSQSPHHMYHHHHHHHKRNNSYNTSRRSPNPQGGGNRGGKRPWRGRQRGHTLPPGAGANTGTEANGQ